MLEAYHEDGRPDFAELRDAFERHHGEIIEYCVETSKSTRDVGPRAKGLW